MHITVVGSGYVGLVAAACLAEIGHHVVCVDNDFDKIAILSDGGLPIHEDYLGQLLAHHLDKKLSFSTSLKNAARESNAIFIAVGTPPLPDGSANLSCVDSVVREIANCLAGYQVVIVKSTVPLGTSEHLQLTMAAETAGRCEFDVASNPEFLREGSAVVDFLYPDRIIVGTKTDRARRLLQAVYAPLISGSYQRGPGAVPKPAEARCKPVYLETLPQSAELVKLASNAFLATKISFSNAVSQICDVAGADIEEVRMGMGSDHRIGLDFLKAGIGFGGSCFPKDLAAFRATADGMQVNFALLDEVAKINIDQRTRFIDKVRRALGTIANKRLGVLGLAFKSGTDDIRDSPAIAVIKALLDEGARITAYDPAAMARTRQVLGSAVEYAMDSYSVAQGADALLVLTEWKEFQRLDLGRIQKILRFPIVVDGRNLFSPDRMAKAGLTYYSIGRPAVNRPHPLSLKSRQNRKGMATTSRIAHKGSRKPALYPNNS